MEDIKILDKIPDFSQNTYSPLSVNRLPIELPGVMGAAELEKEYQFKELDLSADWSVDVYSDIGVKSDIDCDTSGVTTAQTQIFTYINTVRDIQADRRWLLEAVAEDGLTYAEDSSGITKGPAMPVGQPTTYLFTPNVIPSIEIPGVTAPKVPGPGDDEDDPNEKFDPNFWMMSVDFVDIDTRELIGDTREVCSPPEKPTLGVKVTYGYNPMNPSIDPSTPGEDTEPTVPSKNVPEKSKLLLKIYVAETSNIVLYPGDSASGKGGRLLTLDLALPTDNRDVTQTCVFTYDAGDGPFDSLENSRILAELIFTAPKGDDNDEEYGESVTDRVTLECSDFSAKDIFDFRFELKDQHGKTVEWSREVCDANSGVSGYNNLTLVCTVSLLDEKKASMLQADDGDALWGAGVKFTADNDILVGGINSSPTESSYGVLNVNLPTSKDNPKAVTSIGFQYVTLGYECAEALANSNKSGNIKITGQIHKAWIDFDPSLDASNSSALTVNQNLTLKCTCKECSKDITENLQATIGLFEEGGEATGTSAKSPRTVCELPGTTPDPSNFDAKIEINWKAGNDSSGESANACVVNKEKSRINVVVEGSSGVSVKAGNSGGAFSEKFEITAPIPDNGSRSDVLLNVAYQAPNEESWSGKITISVQASVTAEDGTVTESKLTERSITLRCSGDDLPSDACVKGVEASIILNEAANGLMSHTKADKTRKICSGDKDSPSDFFVTPEVTFPTVPGVDCESLMRYTGTLTFTGTGGALVGSYNGNFSESYTVSFDESGIPNEHIAYSANKSGGIKIYLKVEGESENGSGEVVPWSATKTETISIKCNSDEENEEEDKEDADASCAILNNLVAGDGINITDCAEGKRTVSFAGKIPIVSEGAGIKVTESNGDYIVALAEGVGGVQQVKAGSGIIVTPDYAGSTEYTVALAAGAGGVQYQQGTGISIDTTNKISVNKSTIEEWFNDWMSGWVSAHTTTCS